MSKPVLHFESLHVRRMPGITDGGFPLEELSKGINIIYGPNGIGKSTTALALQTILWPHITANGADLAAEFSLDEEKWSVIVQSGNTKCRRGDQRAEHPIPGDPEERYRYHLALHELIKERNESFAQSILKASQGNFDLIAAAEELKFTEKPSRKDKLLKALRTAKTAVINAAGKQHHVMDLDGKLAGLEEDRTKADKASKQVRLLEQARELDEARAEYDRAKNKIKCFPEWMSALTGGEVEIINSYPHRLNDLEEEKKKQEGRITTAKEVQTARNLPKGPIPPAEIAKLTGQCGTLRDLNQDINNAASKLAESKKTEKEIRQRLGKTISDKQLEELDRIQSSELSGLSTFAEKTERVRARERVIAERARWFDHKPSDIDQKPLTDAITCLANWLASPESANGGRQRWSWAAWGMAGLVSLQGILLAILHHWSWAFLAPISLLLILVGRHRPHREKGGRREVWKIEFEKLNLPGPMTWEPDAVTKRLRELNTELANAEVEKARFQHWQAHAEDTEEVENLVEELDRKRKELIKRFGVEPKMDDAWLYLLAANLAHWQQAQVNVVATDVACSKVQKKHDKLLRAINDELSLYFDEQASDANHALQLMKLLEGRCSDYREAVQTINNAQGLVNTTANGITAAKDEYAEIFTKLGLDIGDEDTVLTWADQQDEYKNADRELFSAGKQIERAENTLIAHPELAELPREEIESQLVENEQLAATLKSVSVEIGKVKNAIEEAKRSHNLQIALAERQESYDELRDTRENDYAAVVGAALIEYVKREVIDANRPQVFKRGRELLSEITRGQFELAFDDSVHPPEFLAKFCDEPMARELDTLSTAERIQLLLSVRLAFVEQREQVARLPLLMDETLANSDDERAGVIIESIIEIARLGRQVFYFTAQDDEVSKWLGALNVANVAHKLINLADVRHKARAEMYPLNTSKMPKRVTPRPKSLSYEEYGKALDVPCFDPWEDNIAPVHLWHLLDDTSALYGCVKNGIISWGQLRNLADSDGLSLFNDGEPLYKRVQIVARALECAIHQWRIGRGRPVDRQALMDSGAVSRGFIDQLTEVAERCQHDAITLLRVLDAGEIPHWGKTKTHKLRQYLAESGYLDTRLRLSQDDIRVQALAAVAEDLREGLICQDQIDRLLAQLPN